MNKKKRFFIISMPIIMAICSLFFICDYVDAAPRTAVRSAPAARKSVSAIKAQQQTVEKETVVQEPQVAVETEFKIPDEPEIIENKSNQFEVTVNEIIESATPDNSFAEMIRKQRAALEASESSSSVKTSMKSGQNSCDVGLRQCMMKTCGNDFTKCATDGDTIFGDKLNKCRRDTECSGEEFTLFTAEIKSDRDMNVKLSSYNNVVNCGNQYNACIMNECGTTYSKCLGRAAETAATQKCATIARECMTADSGLASRVSTVLGKLRENAEKDVKKDEKRLYDLRDLMKKQCTTLGAMFDERTFDCVYTVNFYAGTNQSTPTATRKRYAGDTFVCMQEWFGVNATTFKENAYRETRAQTAASSAMLGSGVGTAVGLVTSGAMGRALETQKAKKELKCAENGGTWKDGKCEGDKDTNNNEKGEDCLEEAKRTDSNVTKAKKDKNGECKVKDCADGYSVNSDKTGCDKKEKGEDCKEQIQNETQDKNIVVAEKNRKGKCEVKACVTGYTVKRDKTGCEREKDCKDTLPGVPHVKKAIWEEDKCKIKECKGKYEPNETGTKCVEKGKKDTQTTNDCTAEMVKKDEHVTKAEKIESGECIIKECTPGFKVYTNDNKCDIDPDYNSEEAVAEDDLFKNFKDGDCMFVIEHYPSRYTNADRVTKAKFVDGVHIENCKITECKDDYKPSNDGMSCVAPTPAPGDTPNPTVVAVEPAPTNTRQTATEPNETADSCFTKGKKWENNTCRDYKTDEDCTEFARKRSGAISPEKITRALISSTGRCNVTDCSSNYEILTDANLGMGCRLKSGANELNKDEEIERCIKKITTLTKVQKIKGTKNAGIAQLTECPYDSAIILMAYNRLLTAEEAKEIAPIWDYSRGIPRRYEDDGKIKDYERDACDTANRLERFINNNGVRYCDQSGFKKDYNICAPESWFKQRNEKEETAHCQVYINNSVLAYTIKADGPISKAGYKQVILLKEIGRILTAEEADSLSLGQWKYSTNKNINSFGKHDKNICEAYYKIQDFIKTHKTCDSTPGFIRQDNICAPADWFTNTPTTPAPNTRNNNSSSNAPAPSNAVSDPSKIDIAKNPIQIVYKEDGECWAIRDMNRITSSTSADCTFGELTIGSEGYGLEFDYGYVYGNSMCNGNRCYCGAVDFVEKSGKTTKARFSNLNAKAVDNNILFESEEECKQGCTSNCAMWLGQDSKTRQAVFKYLKQ